MKRLLIVVIMMVPLLAIAQIYKSIDSDGTVTFSDQPSTGARKIDLPPLQHYKPDTLEHAKKKRRGKDYSKAKPASIPIDAPHYEFLRVLSPKSEAKFHNIGGTLNVDMVVKPSLQLGDELVLFLDGAPVFSKSTEKLLPTGGKPQYIHTTVGDVHRGEHHFQARVFRGGNKMIIESPPVRFYVFQASQQIPPKRK